MQSLLFLPPLYFCPLRASLVSYTMAEKTRATTSTLLLLFLTTSTISLSLSSTTPLQYQTLHLTSLPNPATLSSSLEESLSSTTLQPDTPYPSSITLQLHHVDTLPSTFNATPQQLFNLRLQRDASRVSSLTSLFQKAHTTRRPSLTSPIVSGLPQGSGEYFTRLGVGTPPKYISMALDTGSDVVWIQCTPCKKCYSQADHIFNPSTSRTFSNIPCGSPLCHRLYSPGCNTIKNLCLYQVSYGDGSFTFGEFSTETLTFRRSRVPRVALGCSHNDEGMFVGAGGLLALGRGRLSFPSQTGRRFNRKFSYCLVDWSSSSNPSSLVFGDSAVFRSARFTPLLTNPKLATFYYVELLGISVGGMPVPGITRSLFKLDQMGNGGVIIDSGTSVTRLTQHAYVALRNAFQAEASHLKRAPNFSLFDTCYDLSGHKEVEVPSLVMHFKGVDVPLPASNILIPVDTEGSFCFAFAGTRGDLSIIGNIQQQSFGMIFDLAGSRVGFAPNGCA